MNKLFLIIQREYVQMVCKKSFIITTILVPILSIVLCGVLPVMLSGVKSEEKKNVAIVDQNPEAPFAALMTEDDEFRYINISALPTDSTLLDAHALYESARENQDIYALVVIPDRFVDNPNYNIYSEKSVNANLERNINACLQDAVRAKRIESYGIDSLESVIKHCSPRIKSTNIKWSESGEENLSSADLSMILGFALAMLTYMFVIIYGALIMNSVVEEKTNRIVEVIVSTCKPIQLMLGKIVGVALVGLTQLILWGILLGIVGMIFGISTMATVGQDMSQAATDPAVTQAVQEIQQSSEFSKIVQMVLSVNYTQIFICFLLYFIGGYLLYASLFAAFGSAVDQASDASQFTAPIMMIMIFALYAGMFCMSNPDGPLAFWCSMIPFTSPVVMMIRLPYDLPWYELAGSLALLFLTAFGILWLSARIYRTGILMYGRKFTFKEIVRWVRNK
ncbi:MAG: ABC transporter permease [Bacteroidales bacterium]|nr:ABC transporter permease [Bacteroidales bacterium]